MKKVWLGLLLVVLLGMSGCLNNSKDLNVSSSKESVVSEISNDNNADITDRLPKPIDGPVSEAELKSAEEYVNSLGLSSEKRTPGGSHLGIWLWDITLTKYGTHEALADELKSMGVKRIYVKVNDGVVPTKFQGLLSKAVVNAYKTRGLEVWAWAYDYPDTYKNSKGKTVTINTDLQAQAAYDAAKVGYEGFVIDAEAEFEQTPSKLAPAVKKIYDAKQKAISDGVATSSFKLYFTSFGQIGSHSGVRIKDINTYIDAFMPQTYVEWWGQSAVNDPVSYFNLCEKQYRNTGITKPIYHIIGVEGPGDGRISVSSAKINDFFKKAGNEACLWRVPNKGDTAPVSQLATIKAVNWKMFDNVVTEQVTVDAPTQITVNQTFTVTGTATAGIKKVKGYMDSYQLNGAEVDVVNGKYSFSTSVNTAGTRVLKVVGMGTTTISAEKTVTVVAASDEKVTLTVVDTVNVGDTVTITGTASSGITKVRGYIDDVALAAGEVSVANGKYTFNMILSKGGTRVLKVVGTGTKTVTAAKTITVKDGGTTGDRFVAYYTKNYSTIATNVSYFHTGSYGCAAFCSTALKMFGINVKQVKVTNDVESQLKSLGWKAIADLSNLKPGDVVFTDKATSNIAGTWSHVYVFVKYKSAGTAIINDNNGKNIERNIFTGPNSVSKIAYRAP